MKFPQENEYSVKTLSKEKRELQQELDKLKDRLREQTKENNTLEENISSLNQVRDLICFCKARLSKDK